MSTSKRKIHEVQINGKTHYKVEGDPSRRAWPTRVGAERQAEMLQVANGNRPIARA